MATTITGTSVTSEGIVTNTLGTSNFVAGVNAGNSITSGGNYNTVVGDEAGTAITTGTRNTATGYGSLEDCTTGEYNSAFGLASLASNTTADNNTAVGYAALNANTTADNNTAVGYSSLGANTTGGSNTSVGSFALAANTTASTNTAVGYASMQDNTTGANNVSLGYEALGDNTTAAGNAAAGYKALRFNTTGASLSAFGAYALYNNTTGSNNTAVGYSSLTANTTGQHNIAIGHSAGSHSTNLVTGYGCILLGNYCHSTTTDASYATGIGYNIAAAAGYTTIGVTNDDIRAAHGNTSWSTVSDERYKKDITTSTAGLSFINDLTPRTWNYKTLGELPETFNAYEADSTQVFKNTQTNHGFIAQEVKAVIDNHSEIKDGFRLWDDREDGSQEVAEAALIPVLVKAIQELSTQNAALAARLTALEE